MALIQVKEHQKLYIRKDGEKTKRLSLSEKQAALLERADLPNNVVQWLRKEVKFSQYCGVIALGADIVEVLPKIHGLEGDEGSCRDVLVHMLAETGYLKTHPTGVAGMNVQKHHLFDIFVDYFCTELYKQLHQGFIKTYVTQEDNRSVLKGRLLLPEQIRHNAVHKERFYCQFDEFVTDNPYNQLIKAVLVLLNKKVLGAKVKRSLNELLLVFDEIDIRPKTARDVDLLPRNRMVNRYSEVFRLCRMFLGGLNPDVRAGKNSSPSLMFDMNLLFEEFVTSRLSKIMSGSEYWVKAQKPQRYLARNVVLNKSAFLMKPDITIGKDEKVHVIIDTKWKLLDGGNSKGGVSRDDMYQMCAYAQGYGCEDIALLYPWHVGMKGMTMPEFKVVDSGVRVKVMAVDLSGLKNGKGGCDQELKKIILSKISGEEL